MLTISLDREKRGTLQNWLQSLRIATVPLNERLPVSVPNENILKHSISRFEVLIR